MLPGSRELGTTQTMCGICGVVDLSPEGGVDPAVLASMNDAIEHRGPDDAGTYVSRGVGLGARRLSIIDVEGGHQPIQNEDGSLTIVFNGEIYNHETLHALLAKLGYRFSTRSDTEVIVHAYAEFGDECVKYLNGMFAFAIWDARARRLFVARDRFGDAFFPDPARFRSRSALCRVSAEALPFRGGCSFTPERRAFERPIAIACSGERAPCLPSRM